jgi:all-trans-retinol dehydrogenase (NAD+)
MVERNHGHIVTIASSAGLFGCNRLTDYCGSKFANVGFAETLDYEMESANLHGIHSTVVCPYFINTGMFDGCNTR